MQSALTPGPSRLAELLRSGAPIAAAPPKQVVLVASECVRDEEGRVLVAMPRGSRAAGSPVGGYVFRALAARSRAGSYWAEVAIPAAGEVRLTRMGSPEMRLPAAALRASLDDWRVNAGLTLRAGDVVVELPPSCWDGESREVSLPWLTELSPTAVDGAEPQAGETLSAEGWTLVAAGVEVSEGGRVRARLHRKGTLMLRSPDGRRTARARATEIARAAATTEKAKERIEVDSSLVRRRIARDGTRYALVAVGREVLSRIGVEGDELILCAHDVSPSERPGCLQIAVAASGEATLRPRAAAAEPVKTDAAELAAALREALEHPLMERDAAARLKVCAGGAVAKPWFVAPPGSWERLEEGWRVKVPAGIEVPERFSAKSATTTAVALFIPEADGEVQADGGLICRLGKGFRASALASELGISAADLAVALGGGRNSFLETAEKISTSGPRAIS